MILGEVGFISVHQDSKLLRKQVYLWVHEVKDNWDLDSKMFQIIFLHWWLFPYMFLYLMEQIFQS